MTRARRAATLVVAALAIVAMAGPASAQGLAGLEKQVLPMTRANWVAFRNWGGRQFVYFTHLMAYRCGLAEVRYRLEPGAKEAVFPLPPCDPQNPHAIDAATYPPYLDLPLGTATGVAVQVVYKDGEESETVHLAPCDAAGEATCAVLVE